MSIVNDLLARLKNWLSPIGRYEIEIAPMLLARKQANDLYQKVTKGMSSLQLLESLQQMSQSTRITAEKRGRANLLLSKIYESNIQVPGFTLQADPIKAAAYLTKAGKDLGTNLVVNEVMTAHLGAIRAGGEPQFALNQLKGNADSAKHSLVRTWASKVLTFVYRFGIDNPVLKIPPDTQLAEKYGSQALSGLKKFDQRMEMYSKLLSNVWLNKRRARKALGQLAETSDIASYYYAELLRSKRRVKERDYLPYYEKIAESKPETAMAFASEGYLPAKESLIECYERRKCTSVEEDRLTAYRFQLASNPRYSQQGKHLEVIASLAQGGDFLTNLQAAYCCLQPSPSPAQDRAQQAERYFKKADQQMLAMSGKEAKLYDRVSYRLGKFYERLFRKEPSSWQSELTPTAKAYLTKAIYYFEKISPQFKHYSAIHYEKVGHYKKYNLQEEKSAAVSFARATTEGRLSAPTTSAASHLAVRSAFKVYWQDSGQKLSEEQKTAIAEMKGFSSIEQKLPTISNQKLEGSSVLKMLQVLMQELRGFALKSFPENKVMCQQVDAILAQVNEHILKEEKQQNLSFSSDDDQARFSAILTQVRSQAAMLDRTRQVYEEKTTELLDQVSSKLDPTLRKPVIRRDAEGDIISNLTKVVNSPSSAKVLLQTLSQWTSAMGTLTSTNSLYLQSVQHAFFNFALAICHKMLTNPLTIKLDIEKLDGPSHYKTGGRSYA